MKSRPIAFSLALAAVFFAVLLPPEAYPDGKVAVLLCATFAFFANLSEKRIGANYLHIGLAIFGLLLLHSVFLSVDPYRSLDMVSVLWAYYCLIGCFSYSDREPLKPLAVSMVVLCVIVSGYGLYQYFWGFERLYNFIFYGATNQVVKVPALERIATRRVFSTLALPGTLWGFLTIALPFHAALWREGKLVRGFLALSAAMLLAAGFLTRSFGFLVGLLVLALAWLALKHRRMVWNRLTPVLIVLVLAGGVFYSARRGVIEGANPASLRLMNWISAWTIFAANPLGTGLNTYGVVYSRYMLPGANETQYAHNTPLQLLSELGYPVLIVGAAALLLAFRRRREMERTLSVYVVLALAVWAVHNLIDINIYFPSVGVIGAVLLGTLLHSPSTVSQPPGRTAPILASALGIAILAFSGLTMVSSELQVRAKMEFDENKLAVSAETLELAKSIMPLNSSLFHDSGDVNLNLFHKRHDPRYLEAATQSFRRAIALSPLKAGSHMGLSLCLGSASQVEEAIIEIRVAQRLYPDSTYIESVSKLLEKRNAGIAR